MDHHRADTLPVDRGWAWVVLAGCFSVYFCYAGVVKSFGILFVEFILKYQESAAVTALVSGLESGCFTLSALFSLTVGLRYMSPRTIVMLGGALCSTGFVLSRFAQDVYFLLVTYGIIFGIGHGMLSGPIICILADYFENKRAIANGIAMSACSVGGLLFAPLCRFLLDEYDLQGTLLILGGILLNILVAGSLLRPIDFFSVEKRRSELKKKSKKHAKVRKDTAPPNETNGNIGKTSHLLDTDEPFRARSPTADSTFSPLARKAMLTRMRSRTESEVTSMEPMLPVFPPKEEYDREREMSKSSEVTQPNKIGLARYFSNESLLNIALASSAGFRTSRESLKSRQKTLSGSSDIGSTTNFKDKKEGFCRGIFNIRVLCNLSFVLYAPGYFLGSVSSSLPIIYIPAHAADQGIHGQMAALLLSLTGASDAIGRVMVGVIADQFHLNPKYLTILALVVNGIMQHLFAICTSYWSFVLYSIVYGIFSGFLYSLFPVIIMEMVGTEDFRSALTVIMLGQGIAFSISNPLIGVLKDITGTYGASYCYLGTCALVGATLISIESIVQKCRSLRKPELDNEMSPHSADEEGTVRTL